MFQTKYSYTFQGPCVFYTEIHSTSFVPISVLTPVEANVTMKHPPQSIPGASSYLPVSLNTLNNNSLLKKKVIAALCSAPLYPKHPSCCLTAFPTLKKHYTSCSVRGLPGMKNYNPNTCWMGQKPCSVSRCSVSRFFSMTKLLTLLPQCHTLNISRPADLCCFWLIFKHFWRLLSFFYVIFCNQWEPRDEWWSRCTVTCMNSEGFFSWNKYTK